MKNNNKLNVEVEGDLDEDIEDDLADQVDALNLVAGDFHDTISQHLFEKESNDSLELDGCTEYGIGQDCT